MAEDESLPPLEIPWKLACTTQPLTAGEPADIAISLFFYEPDDEALTAAFPDERLVYLKFTTTISPKSGASFGPAGSDLHEAFPCLQALLDVRISKDLLVTGTERPYFHAAAPLRRTMAETGVVGLEVFEGEADGQFMGKSGTQVYESSSSRAVTGSTTSSYGMPGLGLGASVRNTATNVTAERATSQVVDTTTRDASQERRELVSHHTNVENVLTLLNAKYVGTPHLRFSLSPQPLRLLALDPSDPNLWYSQLLRRRSSGIEGIQEFTAAVLVPRDDQGFCVTTILERVWVPEVPPGPLDYKPWGSEHLVAVSEYLHRAYPMGTPVEELDVDVVSLLPGPAEEWLRPTVWFWDVQAEVAILNLRSPLKETPHLTRHAAVAYKLNSEAWLDAQDYEYARRVSRSPLERVFPMSDEVELRTCFAFPAAGGLEVAGACSVEFRPAARPTVDQWDVDIGGVASGASSMRAPPRERAFEVVTRWNLLEERLGILLANRREPRRRQLEMDDPRVLSLLIEGWARLPPDSPRNLRFDAAVKSLRLGRRHREVLKGAGASDLRSIGRLLETAPAVARHNEALERLADEPEGGRSAPVPVEPLPAPLSPEDEREIREAIGKGLAKAMQEAGPGD
jgi:hypothetical protein